ncbi:PGN_0703 family putative restriction endonuclease [Cupriavidus necator]|uniref:PGN_0703 family putative restriction endonuclease n=1 Tax=Cupriavidus necator TaxID=106590 RepID=UPI00339DA4E2
MSVTAICREQQEWAANRGIAFDARGYVPHLDLNLMRPLSPATLAAFANGDGGELLERGDRPAKMRALHSSSALAANIFDFWTDCADATPLMKALALPSCPTAALFESKLSTGVDSHANLDVCLPLANGVIAGVESKFTEWLRGKATQVGEAFRPPYLANGRRRWEEVGLPRAQGLTEALQEGREAFRHIGAPQLLKHALALARQYGNRWVLRYVYFDWPGPHGERHRDEIRRFQERVGDELKFKAISYQAIFGELCSASRPEYQPYLAYLGERYFRQPMS